MHKYMSELGMTPAFRTRVEARVPGTRSKSRVCLVRRTTRITIFSIANRAHSETSFNVGLTKPNAPTFECAATGLLFGAPVERRPKRSQVMLRASFCAPDLFGTGTQRLPA